MSPDQQQTVHAVNGFAYGCIGADIHVFGNGVPLYVLQRWRPEAQPDSTWLLELPSRVLNSRFAVVDFTGREQELADLRRWRDQGPRLAVQWLHAPGGQGKSRLASQFAMESEAAGWTVATAARGPGVTHPPPGSQDLTVTDVGALLIVDYADRWPVSDLTWLLSNTLLHRPTDQARVLLLARNRDAWPAVRAAIANLQADTSTHALPPLADAGDRGIGERHDMFLAARDAFTDLYGVPANVIDPPDGLSEPDFGLTLAVHMAALVAVDQYAHAGTEATARDMTGLTAYLLDRERRHWRTLHETRAIGSTVTEISRAVFVASLTGSLPYREAKEAFERAGLDANADRLLTDHAYCYPPGASDTVLEPLYPDRLAEDFLALSIPGHDLPRHTADPWAAGIPELLLPKGDAAPDGDGGTGLPSYAARTIAFLTVASHRWHHVLTTLEALDARLPDSSIFRPEEPRVSDELAASAADLTERLAPHRLSAATGAAERARIHHVLGQRLHQASRHEQAATAFAEAVRLYHDLADSKPRDFEAVFAQSSFELAWSLAAADIEPSAEGFPTPDVARLDQAAAAFRNAIEVYRRLAAENPTEYQENLVGALMMSGFLMPRLGPSGSAVATALEAIDIARHLADEKPDDDNRASNLAAVLVASAIPLTGAHPGQARALADEAIGIARRIARDDPAKYAEHLDLVLAARAAVLLMLERAEDAIDALSEAAELNDRGPQAGQDSDAWYEVMARALSIVWVQERAIWATTGISMAMRVFSRLVHGDTSGRAPALLAVLIGLRGILEAAGRLEDVLSVERDIVHLLRTSDEISYVGDGLIGRSEICGVLVKTSARLARMGRWDDALAYLEEAARELRDHDDLPLGSALQGAVITMTADLADLPPAEDGDHFRRMAQPEAVRVLERIAETYRRLVRDDPASHEIGLAVTTTLLSEAMWGLGRSQEAVEAGQESVRARRNCAVRDTDAEHRAPLALALQHLADKLTDTGQAEQAVAAAQEAAVLWSALSKYRNVAPVLYLAAWNLRGLRPAEALSAAEEAAVLLTRFPDDDPAEHRDHLAMVNSLIAEIRQELRE